MTKSEQWKLAAIVLAHCDTLNGSEAPQARNERAWAALTEIYSPLPWEYPWMEVIRSHRARKAASLAKSQAKA